MKKHDENASGLFIGSEPVDGMVEDRKAMAHGDDGKDVGGPGGKDTGDDDSSDKGDSDGSDKGDGGDDSKDADGKD